MTNNQNQDERPVPPESDQPAGDMGNNSEAVDQVFSMFKDYFEWKIEDKGNDTERTAKSTEVVYNIFISRV